MFVRKKKNLHTIRLANRIHYTLDKESNDLCQHLKMYGAVDICSRGVVQRTT